MKRTGSARLAGRIERWQRCGFHRERCPRPTQYSFGTRFEDGKGTNPEELIGAAHASCFAMALSGQLGEAGMKAESIDVKATISLDKLEGGWTVTASHLDVKARIPGVDRAKFDTAAKNAKEGCPISKLLKADITMTAEVEG